VNASTAPGQLYVVSTPIGNLGDFSFRAIDTLKTVAQILAEDTRHSRTLLDRYEITTPVASYHEHNEAKMTPRVSDPGARLVAAALDAGVTVVPIPGASALLAALVASGISADRFTFYGFLPRKGRERAELLAELGSLAHAAILYEAPTRLAETLAELEAAGSRDRMAAVAREMTKQFEEVRRGTVSALRAYYNDTPPRGEVVLVLAGVAPASASEQDVRERARALRAEGRSVRDVVAQLVSELGVARNQAYRIAQEE
jgi:16S rRNA (cytidine1402-2'-O)-methyltransferase